MWKIFVLKWIPKGCYVESNNFSSSPVNTNLTVGPCQTIPEKQTYICLEANDQRILKQKIEGQLYSSLQQAMAQLSQLA